MRRVNVFLVDFVEAEAEIRAVRDRVFGEEQGVPEKINWDGHDGKCLHVIVRDTNQKVIGTGRLAPCGKIGRLAVMRSCRGRGVGGEVLARLLCAARDSQLSEVFLHAQTAAIGFYERQGFEAAGSPFNEAGIEHFRMARSLQKR
ncbi:MAG: GNAT family N-acetyltransferase [Roseibacillus sp.]|nr:GNAT family N-acetyltransferase [Roseibacillus sp.]